MRECEECRSEIDERATTCPYCRTQDPFDYGAHLRRIVERRAAAEMRELEDEWDWIHSLKDSNPRAYNEQVARKTREYEERRRYEAEAPARAAQAARREAAEQSANRGCLITGLVLVVPCIMFVNARAPWGTYSARSWWWVLVVVVPPVAGLVVAELMRALSPDCD